MNIYEAALNKVIVILGVTRNKDQYYFVGTRNRRIVELTQGNSNLLNNISSDREFLVDFYDLKNDKIETIDFQNGEVNEFTLPGLPFEIAPPMFLNPKWENETNNNTLIELQKNIIDIIVNKKTIPAFKENKVNFAKKNQSVNFFNDAKMFSVSSDYLLDEKDELYYFKLTCDGDHFEKFNSEFKEFYELIHLKPLFVKIGYDFKSINELRTITASKKDEIKQKWIDYLENKKAEKLSDLAQQFESTKNSIDDVNLLNVATFQYEALSLKIQAANYSNILKNINDMKMFLRYSPDYIDNSDIFTTMAPFADMCLKIIDNLIVSGVITNDEYLKEIYDSGVNTFCNAHLQELKNVRKQQIINRKNEILTELTTDEQNQVAPFLSEDSLFNKLDILTQFYDVLSFWPPVLGKRPEYVLPS
jgi:hypothetical protein